MDENQKKKFEKQLDNVLYEAGLEKPQHQDLIDIGTEINEFMKILPRYREIPPKERTAYFREFLDCLMLMYGLIIATHPHTLINQDLDTFEIYPELDEDE